MVLHRLTFGSCKLEELFFRVQGFQFVTGQEVEVEEERLGSGYMKMRMVVVVVGYEYE